MAARRPSGFAAFTVIWVGQMASALGTRMTNFALSIWLWQATGRVTDLALLMFCAFGATVLLSPIAGALIDRWNRRLTIVISDAGALLVTGALLALYVTDSVSPWHLYLANTATGGLLAFQLPAYAATISLMMAKGEFPKANAMMSVVRFGPAIFAPTLAAALLGVASIETVLALDLASYAVAIVTVFLVAIPPTPAREPTAAAVGVWKDSLYGFRYIARRRPLLNLEALLFVISWLAAIGYTMIIPLILARSGDETQAGLALSVGAIGGVGGAVLIGTLRPTRDKMRRILLAILAFSLVGRVLFGVSNTLVLWCAAMFVVHLCIPFIDGYSQAIWQEKVRPAVQGRVFAARQFFENLAIPLGLLVAGPAADHLFTPLMMPGRPLAEATGWLLGTGTGAAMGLITVLVGLLGVLVVVAGFSIHSIRRVEVIVPDHDEVMPPTAGGAGNSPTAGGAGNSPTAGGAGNSPTAGEPALVTD